MERVEAAGERLRSDRASRSRSNRRCDAALFGRDPDLQRPRLARALPGEHRPAPAGRSRPVDRSHRGRRRARPTARPNGWRTRIPTSAWSALERNGGFCAAANAGIAAAQGRFIQLLNNDTEVTAGWIEAGLAPFADPTVGSVAPLVLVRSDPGRVDSAGDSYALAGWPTKRGHGQPGASVCRPAGRRGLRRQRIECVLPRRRAPPRRSFDPLFGSYYEDIDLAFRLRWAGYRCLFVSGCVIYHDVSATYDHGSPALQRRMARNAEIVFWANLPAGLLALAWCLTSFSWQCKQPGG